MSEQFFTKKLSNGIMLLGQKMENVSSGAMTLVLPAGVSHDTQGSEGSASIAMEWCMKGAGNRNTRQLNDALDSLGCHHHTSVQSKHVIFSAVQLGSNLGDVLGIFADIILRPRLEKETFAPSKALVAHDLAALEDEPAQKCNLLLREKFYPYPLGRCIYGTEESLNSISSETAREHLDNNFTPKGTMLAVAGNINWDEICRIAEENFGSWQPQTPPEVKIESPQNGITHIKKDSAQTHIALAHKTVTISDKRYFAARMAETILSGGMSSRLFTEVREKRGLVYHVSSRYSSLKDYAGMFTYAGTPPEKAQETFEVTVGELKRLADGIEAAEMDRARTQLKSSLIMQGESTSARSGALAGDWYQLGKLRSLKEISNAIDAVTTDDVLSYLKDFPAKDFTVLIIGPEPLNTSTIEK